MGHCDESCQSEQQARQYTVATDKTDRQCRAKKWWVTYAGVDGLMEMWVRWWTRHFFGKKRDVGQATNRGEASRSKKSMLVR